MYWLLGLSIWGRCALAHEAARSTNAPPPALTSPADVSYRGHAFTLSEKEFGFLKVVVDAPDHFATYETLHRWAGWKTKFNPSRLRTFAKSINLKTLDWAGGFVLTDDADAGGLRLARSPVPVAGELERRLGALLERVGSDGALRLTEHQYVALGVPRAELIRAVLRLDPDGRVNTISIGVLTFTSTYRRADGRLGYWYPNPLPPRCEDDLARRRP